MRVPGLGGEVFAKMGVNPILLPAGEIYTSLERGVIDATEWVGPALDIKMGFYKVASYYYSGWHEPGSVLELTFNKQFYDKLPQEFQSIIEMASNEMNALMTYKFHAENIKAFETLKSLGVHLRHYPQDIINEAKKSLAVVASELGNTNEDFRRVYESADNYLKQSKKFSNANLDNFLNIR
jgi:TRAP-type mannitol/chloroaromatic compound transport system substrate-binding protein